MKSTFNYNALGQRVRKRRKELQLTQEQLAEACNLSAAHIGHIERGTRALSIESLLTLQCIDALFVADYRHDASAMQDAALLRVNQRLKIGTAAGNQNTDS